MGEEIKEMMTGQVNAEELLQELSDRALGTNAVSPAYLNSAVKRVLEESGISRDQKELLKRRRTETGSQNDPENSTTLFTLNGRLTAVPADFMLPECALKEAYVLWHTGCAANQWPKFKLITGKDIDDKSMRKRLGEFRFVMNRLEAKRLSLEIAAPAGPLEAMNIFQQIAPGVDTRLAWATVAKKLLEEYSK